MLIPLRLLNKLPRSLNRRLRSPNNPLKRWNRLSKESRRDPREVSEELRKWATNMQVLPQPPLRLCPAHSQRSLPAPNLHPPPLAPPTQPNLLAPSRSSTSHPERPNPLPSTQPTPASPPPSMSTRPSPNTWPGLLRRRTRSSKSVQPSTIKPPDLLPRTVLLSPLVKSRRVLKSKEPREPSLDNIDSQERYWEAPAEANRDPAELVELWDLADPVELANLCNLRKDQWKNLALKEVRWDPQTTTLPLLKSKTDFVENVKLIW